MSEEKRKKKKWPWVVGGIAVVVIGLIILVNHQISSVKSELSQDLSTTALKKTSLENSISASGNVESSSSVNVTSSLNYVVKKVSVNVGDKVSKGDILAVLDKTYLQKTVDEDQQSYDSAVAQYNLKISQSKQSLEDAKNNVAQAQSDFENAKETYAGAMGDSAGSANYKTRYNNAENKDQGTKTAKQTLTTAQTNLTQSQNNYDSTLANDTTTTAKEQLQTAKDNLADATITAPVSGIISAVNVTAGNSTTGGSISTGTSASSTTGTGTGISTGGTALFTIQSENSYDVKASVADYDVIKLSVGKNVSVTVDSTGSAFTGKILTISPAANSSGNYDITTSIENPSANSLRAGMKTTVKIVLDKKDNIYAVPVDAIVRQNGKTYVIALNSSNPRNMKRTSIEVTTGMETDYYTQISGSSLTDGLNVLTDPLNKLKTASSTRVFPAFGGGR